MKKILLIITLALVSVLGACTKPTTDDPIIEMPKQVSIITPGGAVGLSHAKLIHDKANLFNGVKVEIDITDGAVQLGAAFGSETSDIILAPTNLGVKFYNENQKYKFAGAVTWGNIFIATVSNEAFNLDQLEGKTIHTFGAGSVPYIVLEHVLAEKNIHTTLENVGDATSLTQQHWITNPHDFVLVAEPALTVAKQKILSLKNSDGTPKYAASDIKIIDVQQIYNELLEKEGTIAYPQAGVFIKSSFISSYPSFVKKYLEALRASCDFTKTNAEEAVQYAIDDLGYAQPKPILVTSLPGMNVAFKNASESKADMVTLLEIIKEKSPKMIGEKLPDEAFYYTAK